MDVIARRAFERLDVEANRAGGNARQYSSRLARRAEWSLVHDASPLVQAGALQNSQSPAVAEGDGDSGSMEPFRVPALVKIAHFREVEHSFVVRTPSMAAASFPGNLGRQHRANVRWPPSEAAPTLSLSRGEPWPSGHSSLPPVP